MLCSALVPYSKKVKKAEKAVLRIRDVYPSSWTGIFPARIQGQKDSGFRIRIKEFKYLSFRKYYLGFRIWILIFYPSWIPDPGVKKALDSGSRIGDPQCCKKE
jgi:hypothetical protein